MYGNNEAFSAILSHLNKQGDTVDTVTYNYPYAFTETQSKQLGDWFKVGANQFRKITLT